MVRTMMMATRMDRKVVVMTLLRMEMLVKPHSMSLRFE